MHLDGQHVDPGLAASKAITLLIASEVRFLRESLGEVLSRSDVVSVIGYCADVAETLRLACALRPEMVLLDAAAQQGKTAVRQLRERASGVRVVVFAVNETIDTVLGWAEAGISGYIPSSAAISELHSLIAEISRGRQTCNGQVAAALLQRIGARADAPAHNAPARVPLTPRELEIVGLIGNGLSNKEIARRLNIGLATTKSHVHNALGKLNVQRRGQVSSALQVHSRLM